MVTHPDVNSEGIVVDEFSGIASTNRVDDTGSGSGQSTTPAASVVTTNANDLLYGVRGQSKQIKPIQRPLAGALSPIWRWTAVVPQLKPTITRSIASSRLRGRTPMTRPSIPTKNGQLWSLRTRANRICNPWTAANSGDGERAKGELGRGASQRRLPSGTTRRF